MASRLVLITGSTGYVGSVLAPLVAKRYRVRTFDTQAFGNSIADVPNIEHVQGDIRHTGAMSRALEGVTDVIHLAGIVTDALVDMNPQLSWDINVAATRDLCRLAFEAKVGRFIYASSSSVYGTTKRPAIEEDWPKPMTEYARTKLVAEQVVLSYGREMRVAAIRSATCMGPAPRMRLDTIVNVFSAQAYFTGEINLDGGDQWRSNVHVRDAARAYMALLAGKGDHVEVIPVYNITGSNDQARSIANLVATAVGNRQQRQVSVMPTGKTDDRHYTMNASKAFQLLGWKAEHAGIEKAILDNCDWFDAGHLTDWKDSIYYNTRRLAESMKGSA